MNQSKLEQKIKKLRASFSKRNYQREVTISSGGRGKLKRPVPWTDYRYGCKPSTVEGLKRYEGNNVKTISLNVLH